MITLMSKVYYYTRRITFQSGSLQAMQILLYAVPFSLSGYDIQTRPQLSLLCYANCDTTLYSNYACSSDLHTVLFFITLVLEVFWRNPFSCRDFTASYRYSCTGVNLIPRSFRGWFVNLQPFFGGFTRSLHLQKWHATSKLD